MSDSDLDPAFGADAPAVDAVLEVWHDLECALAGKNGFGGDVAEIYAYRLVPGGDLAFLGPPSRTEALAIVAGQNLTRLLRRFTEQHSAHVAIEERQGFRTLDLGCEAVPPFDWRVHLQVTRIHAELPPAPPIHVLRKVVTETAANFSVLIAMLDELGAHRARQRVAAPDAAPADTDDLPPDGATGLYLDRPFVAEDLEWIKAAWHAYLGHAHTPRPQQLALVFHAIHCDGRATAEFLRVMNTVVLPLLRRQRLRKQPDLAKLGAAGE